MTNLNPWGLCTWEKCAMLQKRHKFYFSHSIWVQYFNAVPLSSFCNIPIIQQTWNDFKSCTSGTATPFFISLSNLHQSIIFDLSWAVYYTLSWQFYLQQKQVLSCHSKALLLWSNALEHVECILMQNRLAQHWNHHPLQWCLILNWASVIHNLSKETGPL